MELIIFDFEKDFKSKFDADWIKTAFKVKAIKFADDFGRNLCAFFEKNGKILTGNDALTSTQIRIFFSEVKRIQGKGIEKEPTAFMLLKPKLAYAAKRGKSKKLDEFRIIMEKAIDAVDIENENFQERFQRFVDFMEAILAYHKAYGGKD